MEENRIETMETINEGAKEVYDMEPTGSSGSGILGKVIGGLVVTGIAGAIAYAATHKDKIKNKKLEKKAAQLESAGYLVARPDEIEDEFIEEEVEEVVEDDAE